MVAALRDEKRQIADGYDESAPEYLEFADRLVYTFLARPLVEALRDVNGEVLDVASGTGAFGRQLSQAVAVDLSHEQLLSNPLRPRVRADAERLPFADDSFAAVGCAFGINHFPNPETAVREMARLARVIGLLTWVRPEAVPYAPKEEVLRVIERQAGVPRTESSEMIEQMTEAVGSEAAVRRILTSSGLAGEVTTIEVEVPWPGAEDYVEYRLSMSGVSSLISDLASARHEAITAIAALDPDSLRWRPQLVLGLGHRDRVRDWPRGKPSQPLT